MSSKAVKESFGSLSNWITEQIDPDEACVLCLPLSPSRSSEPNSENEKFLSCLVLSESAYYYPEYGQPPSTSHVLNHVSYIRYRIVPAGPGPFLQFSVNQLPLLDTKPHSFFLCAERAPSTRAIRVATYDTVHTICTIFAAIHASCTIYC